MRKVIDWLKGEVSKERTLEGEITPTYTDKDERDAPSGRMPLPGTDCEGRCLRVPNGHIEF